MTSFPTTYGAGIAHTLPSQGTSGSVRPRVNKVSFGDGYEARAADGINAIVKSWPLTWKSIPEAERTALDDFLTARGGVEAFSWTPPNAVAAVAVKCEDWSWTYGEYNIVDFRATFVRVFEV